ncbi:MAG: CBS domain-containing protein [Desulfosarcina sp.]|nr:CBS domain-containing protein [Desulfobacterales bacterium]
MKNITVKDLMVPLTGFVSVSEDDSLFDAVQALEEAFDTHDGIKTHRRAVLVSGKDGQVVGKVSQLDIIRALEPKYDQMDDSRAMARFGFNPKFISNMLKEFNLWNKPLNEICQKATHIKVKQFMYTLTEGEYVDQDAPIDKAIHQLIIGSRQSLLVTKEKAIIGILRSTDVFKEVCNRIKECQI